jgi:outer membrane protein assembly factor BamD (BamD/ComL family)
MVNEEKRLLKVFLCHASGDKPPVRQLYKELVAEGVDAWLDQEKLLPGQDWRMEIPRAVQEADVVVICLSKKSITKEGYVQKEIKFALDIAEEKPEGTIFLIPARLEECVVPERLSRWQWVDLYEEDGFTKLLRSLKLRANKVGAVIEPTSYETSDKELQRRLGQLYTDGLAAFYTEDWDKACFCFQSILSEQPNHRNATEKLAEAECERKLARLYARSSEAVQSEDWQVAIETLEELLQKSANYKDAAQLLRDAQKRKQLTELYAEARALYAAQKWQAVVNVFKQISVIEPNFPDADELLASAEKEVAEAKRLAELNDRYSRALHEMDSGNWREARRLLENVHKSQIGFLETEKLLRKVENEIVREEEKRQHDEQIDTLYEQAHGLLRSKKWRKALDKLEEIRTLDDQFSDPDQIAEKAEKELECEEREAEQQNKLAALYAESVRLVREEKYQEALQKLEEIKNIDPKYPDRQMVQWTARKSLNAQAKPVTKKPRVAAPKPLWMGLVSIVMIVIIMIALDFFRNRPTNPTLGNYTLTVLDETCPMYPIESDFEGFVSKSDDPLAPWSGTSVSFRGTDQCANREMLGEASLIYRYRLEFDKVTKLNSIAVSGAAFNGPDSVLRVLDENMNVLGIVDTFGGNRFLTHAVTLQGVKGRIFFIDEFDTSSSWRYRENFTVNRPLAMKNLGEFTLTLLPETCSSYSSETNIDGFVSKSHDRLDPWSGTSVQFVGKDECANREMLDEASLIYRYRLEFDKVTKLNSIAVSGAAFNGPDSVLRVLDENKKVLGTAATFGGNTFQTHVVTLQGIEGKIFYIDEFDTSRAWRFRQNIVVNETLR